MNATERLLIITADDCGLSAGITDGILELAGLGTITSTGVLMNLPESSRTVHVMRRAGLAVGAHLNVTLGRPLCPPAAIPSLLGTNREFDPTARAVFWRVARGKLRLADVEREWKAQIDRFIAVGGGLPSHLDTHAHLHVLPGFHSLLSRLALRYGIPRVRGGLRGQLVQVPGVLVGTLGSSTSLRSPPVPWQAEHLATLTVMGKARTPRPVRQLLHALPDGVTEIVCHPSRPDAELRRWDTFARGREREMLLLSRPWFRELLASEGIRLLDGQELSHCSAPRPEASTLCPLQA
jgi:chitin disaccharide deacetylase